MSKKNFQRSLGPFDLEKSSLFRSRKKNGNEMDSSLSARKTSIRREALWRLPASCLIADDKVPGFSVIVGEYTIF